MFARFRYPGPIDSSTAFFDFFFYLIGDGSNVLFVGFIFGDKDLQFVVVAWIAEPLEGVEGDITKGMANEWGWRVFHIVR